jgi:hypothetical protein
MITLRKRNNTWKWKRKHYIALFGELVNEGKIEGRRDAGRGRRRKHLYDLKEKRTLEIERESIILHSLKNSILKKKTEGRRDARRGRRRKHLHDLKEKREHWKLKEKELYHTLWRILYWRKRQKEEVRQDEEEDVRIYRMTLRERENTGNWKHYIALVGELDSEEAVDLS